MLSGHLFIFISNNSEILVVSSQAILLLLKGHLHTRAQKTHMQAAQAMPASPAVVLPTPHDCRNLKQLIVSQPKVKSSQGLCKPARQTPSSKACGTAGVFPVILYVPTLLPFPEQAGFHSILMV